MTRPMFVPFNLIRSMLLAMLFLSTSASAAAPSRQADALDALIRVIDRHADAVVGIPRIKHATDEMTYCMEGMDRANLIIGGRLIDQIKSLVGVHSHIDDVRGMAMMMYDGDSPQTAYVIAVTDVEGFFESNFEPGEEAGAFVHESGMVLHGRAWADGYVLLSEDASICARAEPDWSEPFDRALGSACRTVLQQGEVFVAATSTSLGLIIFDQFTPQLGAMGAPLREKIVRAWNHMHGAALVFDFDSLALVVRLVEHLHEDAPVARAGNETNADHWNHVADAPLMIGMSSDMTNPVVRLLARTEMSLLQWSFDDGALDLITHAEYVAPMDTTTPYPFRRSRIVLSSPDPGALLASIADAVRTTDAPPGMSFTWAAATERTATLTINIDDEQTADLTQQMTLTLLFGDQHTFSFEAVEGALIIHPGEGALTHGGRTFDENPTYAAMRGWLPGQCVMELVFDAANLQRWLRRVRLIPDDTTMIAPGAPPIAIGLSHPAPTRVQTTVIIPVQTLTPMVDAAVRQAGRGGP